MLDGESALFICLFFRAQANLCRISDLIICIKIFRSVGGRGNAAKQAAPAAEEADAARRRFGNAKSISSSQFNSDENSSGNNYEKEVRLFF